MAYTLNILIVHHLSKSVVLGVEVPGTPHCAGDMLVRFRFLEPFGAGVPVQGLAHRESHGDVTEVTNSS